MLLIALHWCLRLREREQILWIYQTLTLRLNAKLEDMMEHTWIILQQMPERETQQIF